MVVRHVAGTAERAGFGDVFEVGEFRALWLAYLASVVGDQLALVAVTVLVYNRTHSALVTALAYAAGFLPWAVGGITLSRLADAYPRRTVMVACDLVRVFIVAGMALPGTPMWALIALLALVTLFNSPFRAARSAMLPDILTGERYVMGNATMQLTNRLGRTAGFAVGGVVVAALGARPSLVVDAATFAVSALLVQTGVRLRPVPDRDAPAQPGEASTGKEPSVVRRVFGDRRLRAILLLGWLVPFYTVAEGVAAPYAHQFHGGAVATGFVLAAGPAGAVVGTSVFSRFVPPAQRLRWMGPLAVCACAILALCLLAPPLAVSLVIFAASLACSAYQLAANAAFVAAVPPSWRGQAFGLANGGINVTMGVWYIAAGAAASVIAPTVVVAVSGLIGVAVGLPLAVSWSRLRLTDAAAIVTAGRAS